MTEHGTGPALRVSGLVHRFGDKAAVDGIDLCIERGEVRIARPERCGHDHHNPRRQHDVLCDRLALMHLGRIRALGHPTS